MKLSVNWSKLISPKVKYIAKKLNKNNKVDIIFRQKFWKEVLRSFTSDEIDEMAKKLNEYISKNIIKFNKLLAVKMPIRAKILSRKTE